MLNQQYINLNGKLLSNKEAVLTSKNRAFLYGDAIFETIRSNANNLFLFDEHFKRLEKGMELLSMNFNSDTNKNSIHREITRTLNKNKHFLGARIRLTIFRNEGGLYTPTDNTVSFLIETSELETPKYSINRKGLKIDIFRKVVKHTTAFSGFKTANALIYTLAGIYKQENNLDDVIMVNENNNLVEAISSNLFYTKGNALFTTSYEDGCVEGIMREQIISIALKNGFTVFDDCNIKSVDLLDADEIFLTNAISGVQWVVAYKHKRYFNKAAKFFIGELNKG